jgi:hypothetical protein
MLKIIVEIMKRRNIYVDGVYNEAAFRELQIIVSVWYFGYILYLQQQKSIVQRMEDKSHAFLALKSSNHLTNSNESCMTTRLKMSRLSS